MKGDEVLDRIWGRAYVSEGPWGGWGHEGESGVLTKRGL